ncbi:neuronal acetylcholine receptor subunit alpha-10-like isoform X2 [Mya arenaria]|uniref:neuronal acetylcholine receptor subunit alpha-10-like isoform X2 n=1 Tax=Mya arenaria TaxID=6604 RepID=UPI0022E380AC|nr:neuronal acetylcholine receptor subunit alpha-10-like isoform X2 [Mya arenaria]
MHLTRIRMYIAVNNAAKLITGMILLCTSTLGTKVLTDNLYNELFTNANYKPQLLPVCEVGISVNISLDIALRQIVSLEEKDQVLTTNIWVRMGWHDCRLRWNSSQHYHITELRVPYGEVWIPDIALYDSSAEEVMMPGMTDYRVQLEHTGEVRYNFPTVLKSICRVEVTYFPFDVQDCQLKLGSWSHSNADLDFYPQKDTGDLSEFVENNEWVVEKLKSARNVKTYGNETYTDITYHIEMRRRSAFYVMTMMFPCILVSFIAAVGFLLPPESGEKVSLEVTVLLSQAVFLLVVSDFLPPSAQNFPILGTYFAVSMMLVGLSLVLAVLVLNVHHRGDIPGKIVPKWSRTFFLEKLSMLCTRKKYRTSGNMNNVKRQCPTEHGVAYEMNSFNHNTRLTSLSENENSETNPQNLTNNNDILKEQLKELQAIRSHFLVDDTTEVEQEDWQRLARVLDRIFLCLYVLCFTIVTLVFVLQLTGGQDVT